MSEKAALPNVQFCKLQDEPKTKHKKESMNYLLIELDQVKLERKKKLALGQDPHFEKHNE